MNEDESLACPVAWWHHEWNAPAFQIYAGLLFGLPLAVTSFNRYSRFAEASSRRVALTVASSYFDDFNIVDWSSSKGSGRWAVGAINGLLGTSFADAKRQAMSSRGTFLGLDHDLSYALSEGYVTFWARDRQAVFQDGGPHSPGRRIQHSPFGPRLQNVRVDEFLAWSRACMDVSVAAGHPAAPSRAALLDLPAPGSPLRSGE